MKLKVFLIALAASVLLAIPVGCAKTVAEGDDISEVSRFMVVEEGATWSVVYDKETLVMYAVSGGTYNRGTFTVLVDETGKPLLYDNNLMYGELS